MANPEHLLIFRQGVKAWNRWRRKHHSVRPDLSDADLRNANLRGANLNYANLCNARLEGANLGRAFLEAAELRGASPRGAHLFDADLGFADLREADLRDAQLWRVRLEGADLQGARLGNADLRCCDLTEADLRGASLRGANLTSARLLVTDVRQARLDGVRFHGAHLCRIRLAEADLSGAEMGRTTITDVDLSQTLGLATIDHERPSGIGVDTLVRTAVGLAADPTREAGFETFLRQAGVPEDFLDLFRATIRQPHRQFSVLIRCSQADQVFAGRLYKALQSRGIRCWLNLHPMLPGDDSNELLARDLEPRDKLLVCCSEEALTSWWIDQELDRAFERERQLSAGADQAPSLYLINLDGYLFAGKWQGPRRDQVADRLTANFRGWDKEDATFEREVESLVRDLHTANH